MPSKNVYLSVVTPCELWLIGTVAEVEAKLEDVDVETESNEDLEGASTPTVSYSEDNPEDQAMDASFMSESIYGKLPSAPPKNKRHRPSSSSILFFNLGF